MVREQSKSLQFAIHAVQGLQSYLTKNLVCLIFLSFLVRVRDMPPLLHLIVTASCS